MSTLVCQTWRLQPKCGQASLAMRAIFYLFHRFQSNDSTISNAMTSVRIFIINTFREVRIFREVVAMVSVVHAPKIDPEILPPPIIH